MDYRVTWNIDVDADNPAEAAMKARLYQTKEDTTATVFEVSRRISESGGIDDGPIFERVAEFDVRLNPSFPFFKALTIEEADEEDQRDGEGRCTNPGGHEFGYSGTAYGGDDPSYMGEGRCYCIHCGADGDA